MAPLEQILQIRAQCINFYKQYERFIIPVLKFIFIVFTFFMINNTIGYSQVLNKTSVILVVALLAVFLSPQMIILLFMMVTSIHIGAGSLEAGGIVFVLFLMIYLLFVRLYPKASLLIIGMLITYKLKVPYITPLVGGLFSSLPAVIAMIIGIAIWYCVPQLVVIMEAQTSDLSDMVDVINTNIAALQKIIKTDQTMLTSIVILSGVMLTVYIIKKQNIDYAEYIAILVGCAVNLIGFLFAILFLKAEVSIPGLIISTIICGAIAVLVQFFSKVVDYSRAEVVQFQDAENYYYVKIVPKIIVNKPKKQVKRIYTNSEIEYKGHEQ